jgi:hypothetical protein
MNVGWDVAVVVHTVCFRSFNIILLRTIELVVDVGKKKRMVMVAAATRGASSCLASCAGLERLLFSSQQGRIHHGVIKSDSLMRRGS